MVWIDVNTEQPDCWSQHGDHYSSGLVLGYTKYGEVEVTQLLYLKQFDGSYKHQWESEDESYITHWMRLPKPPIK